MADTASLRRGTRVRQTTQRAGESAQQAAEEQRQLVESRKQASSESKTPRSRSRSQSPVKATANNAKPSSSRTKTYAKSDAKKSAQSKRKVSSSSGTTHPNDEPDHDEEEEGEKYCVCRGIDDGTPMVECAQCNDWFHFKCVGITKAAARKLEEYTCSKCASETGRLSKNNDGTVADLSQGSESEGASENDQDYDEQDGGDDEDAEGSNNHARRTSLSARAGTKRKPPTARTSADAPKKQRQRSTSSGSHPSRKTSTNTSTSHASSSTNTLKDPVRLHAFTSFKTLLTPAFVAASSGEPEGLGEEAALKYVRDLESELFDAFAEGVGAKKTVQNQYRNRLRMLLYNLRDKNNAALHTKIATGGFTARQLANASTEDLASAEQRARDEKARQEILQQSILKHQDAGPLRKMTHKGEVDIERDDQAPLVDSFASSSSSRAHREDPQPAAGSPQRAAESAATSGSPLVAQSNRLPSESSHLQGSPPRHTSDTTPTPAQPSRFDFSDVWSGNATVPESEQEGDDAQDEEQQETTQDQDDGTYAPVTASDDMIDSFLSGINSPPGTLAAQADHPQEHTAEQSTTPKSSPPPTTPPVLWRGALTMPEETTISGTVKQIAGPRLGAEPALSAALFPQTCCVVAGRLPSQVASDYLLQSHQAARTELTVFALDKSYEAQALSQAQPPVPSSEAGLDASFEQFFNFLSRRQRYGVLLPASHVRGQMIKDFYIAPLAKDSALPEWLAALRSPYFSEQEHSSRETDMILLVVVALRGALQKIAAGQAEVPTPPPRTPANGPDDLSQMLSSRPDALQDLLKAVGGSQPLPSSASSSAPPPTQESVNSVLDSLQSANASQGNAELTSSETAAATRTLSQMPQGDVQSLLAGDPARLAVLLASLDAKKQGAPRPPAPGPPPGPPPLRPPIDLPPRPAPGPPPPAAPYPQWQPPHAGQHHGPYAWGPPAGSGYGGNYPPTPHQQSQHQPHPYPHHPGPYNHHPARGQGGNRGW